MVEIFAQGEGKKKIVDANVAISALPCCVMILNKLSLYQR